jgi:putative pyruvate formate lyase activating enzyme
MNQYPQLLQCRICPRDCGVNRYEQRGFCGASASVAINLYQLHFGEEPPISGTRGSGTIFFSHCNLKCVFCQNYTISCEGFGSSLGDDSVIRIMLELQEQGAHNINLVTPTHYTPQLRAIIASARAQGLKIPLLWNSSAYEKVETLKSLNSLVDIYLPDLKYSHGVYAKKYSHAVDYPAVALDAIKEMYSQVGPLSVDADGIAQKGVLVRLLVLPQGLSGTENNLRRLADEIGPDVPVSLMGQYYPAGEAGKYPELGRGVSDDEYQKVLDTASDLGFSSVYVQELSSNDFWTPKFHKEQHD